MILTDIFTKRSLKYSMLTIDQLNFMILLIEAKNKGIAFNMLHTVPECTDRPDWDKLLPFQSLFLHFTVHLFVAFFFCAFQVFELSMQDT